MKLKDMIKLTVSVWESQEEATVSRLRIDIILCPPYDYIEEPENCLGDLVVSYTSDYKVGCFLKEELLNREVIAIAAPEKNVIMIQIKEE